MRQYRHTRMYCTHTCTCSICISAYNYFTSYMYIVNCYYNMYCDVRTCTLYIISYNYTLCTTTCMHVIIVGQTREGVVRINNFLPNAYHTNII